MAAPPPHLPDEIVEEILLRLPPDDPASLLRASLVCKTWSHALSSAAFGRRLHELHPTPPMLGFLHNWNHKHVPRFIPTTTSSFSLAAPDCRSWEAIDCRHGRALFLSWGQDALELLVWEPITGAQRRIRAPCRQWPSAAVFCAAHGCNHHDCQGGPFNLVCVFSSDEYVTSACLYSSKTGTWGELTSTHCDFIIDFTFSYSVLVRRSLLYLMSYDARIVEYDLARHGLTVFDTPDMVRYYNNTRVNLMLAEDGELALYQTVGTHLKLWSRKTNDGTNTQWVLSRVIHLENLLPNGAIVNAGYLLYVTGFAEGANVIFVNTGVDLFTLELQTDRVRKVCHNHGFSNIIPVVSFYTPVPCYEKRVLAR